MDVIRKLASLRKVSAIIPIEGADRIELAMIDGWQCVVPKGEFSPDQCVVYFEIDSFLPVEPHFEFLRKSCYRNVEGLGEGLRIKTIRLRGQLSQGLVMSMAACGVYNEEEGADLTNFLGVRKYEKPLPAAMQGKAKGNFPAFIPKTDQERIQNCKAKKLGHAFEWEITIKLHGASLTAYHNDGHIGVCSRNYELEDDGNMYWTAARENGLLDFLVMAKANGRNVALQGELMGEGIQGNREGLSGRQFFLFDIYDITMQEFVPPERRHQLALAGSLRHVPLLGFATIEPEAPLEALLSMADISSLNHPVAEGVVFKRVDGEDSFKIINNKFLLDEQD